MTIGYIYIMCAYIVGGMVHYGVIEHSNWFNLFTIFYWHSYFFPMGVVFMLALVAVLFFIGAINSRNHAK